jgi:hypothetical protein
MITAELLRAVRLLAKVSDAELEGEDHLGSIVIEERATAERRREPTAAVFVFIGADAETDWLPPDLSRDGRRLRMHGPRRDGPPGGRSLALAAQARSLPAGNERAGHLRRRRRAAWLDQARGFGRRRREHGAIALVHQYLAEQREFVGEAPPHEHAAVRRDAALA